MANTDVIQKWVTALESGEYKQVKGALQKEIDDNGTVGYCCLGVLCDLAVKEGIIDPPIDSEFVYEGSDGDIRHEGAVLPRPVRQWAGIEWSNPGFDVDFEDAYGEKIGNTSLADMNDQYDKDFTYIAQVIRQNYLEEN